MRAGEARIAIHARVVRAAVRHQALVLRVCTRELHAVARRAGRHHLHVDVNVAFRGTLACPVEQVGVRVRQGRRRRRLVAQPTVALHVVRERRGRAHEELARAEEFAVERAYLSGFAIRRGLARTFAVGAALEHVGARRNGGRAERFDLVQHGVDAFVREPLRHDGDAARERHFRRRGSSRIGPGHFVMITTRSPELLRMPSIIRPIRLVAAACIAFAAAAAAQEPFPTRPVHLIVPVAAGGGIDTAFRTIAPFWGEELGQPVVVENKPGAGQIVGSDFVAKAKPDGYTLLAAGVPIAFNTALGRKLPYDAVRDFTPLSLVVTQPLLIVVHPSVPANSMKDLLAYAKAQPAALHYTSGGIGSYGHLWWEMFRDKQGVAGQHVPYNGVAGALKDVMGGQVPLLIDAIVPTGTQVQAGTVRGIAIVGAQRAKSLPNVPTLAEQGYAGFDAAPFYGVLGPAGMPAPATAKLHATLAKALTNPTLREKLQELGFDVVASTPDAYAKLIKSEIDRWSTVVKTQSIKVE